MSRGQHLRAAAVLTAGTLLFACDSDPTEPEPVRLAITTDKAAYSAPMDYGATPILVNVGRDTVYALMGTYVYAERQVDGEWTYAASWFTVDGVGPSFPVAPGDTMPVVMMRLDYVGRRPGTYRFVFILAYDPEMRRLLPKEERVSTPFRLEP